LPSLPEPLVFFVDRSLGRRVIPNALRKPERESNFMTTISRRTHKTKSGWPKRANAAGLY